MTPFLLPKLTFKPIYPKYLTRKQLKIIYYLNSSSYFNYKKRSKVLPSLKNAISIKKLKKFLITYKQLFTNIHANLKFTYLNHQHKKLFKKNKHYPYFQNYFLHLETYACSILYKSRIIPKLKYMKEFIYHNNLYVNNLNIRGYTFKINPLDFVHINISYILKNKKSSFDKTFKNHIKFIYRSLKQYFLYKKSFFFFRIKKYFLYRKKKMLKKKMLNFYFQDNLNSFYIKNFLFKFLFYKKIYKNFLPL